jgi:hypothetical protein
MNNVFKKRFRRKLGLFGLIIECNKVSASLRENEYMKILNHVQQTPLITSQIYLC